MINETNVKNTTHTRTERERENKKWKIKTWEKWYWGIIEVLLITAAVIFAGIAHKKGKLDWEGVRVTFVLFAIANAIFLAIWGIIKLIIWLVNRNKKESDN